jgi:hypothetical protein
MRVQPHQEVSDCSRLFEPQLPPLLAPQDLYLELEARGWSLHSQLRCALRGSLQLIR